MGHDATWFRVLPERNAWPAEPRFLYCDTTLTTLAMAASGTGVALARAPATDAVVAQLGLVPCLLDAAVDGLESYHLRQPATPLPGPAARAFADWLLAEATGKQAY